MGEWNPSSLGLGHIWGTTYIPSSLWKQALASLSMTYMISDSDWFHPFSCPAFPETSLVSLPDFCFNFFKFWLHSVFFASQVFCICSEWGLLCNCSALAFQSCASPDVDQSLGHSGSVVLAYWVSCPGAFAIFPNKASNAYLKHWLRRENPLEGIWNKSLLHETWHHALFMRRMREDCPCFKPPPEFRTDWSSPPNGSYRILKLSWHMVCSFFSFWIPH